jgi:hypothetical protein
MFGLKPVIVGAVATTENGVFEVAVPEGDTTWTVPVVAPAGTVVTI